MSNDYSAYKDHGENTLINLQLLVEEQEQLELSIFKLETQILALKEKLKLISGTTIPNFMDEIGEEEITLPNGKNVIVKNNIHAKIPEAYETEAFAWIKADGAGKLIKRKFTIEFNTNEEKMASACAEILKENNIKADENLSIHHSTLKAFVKKCLKEGKEIPKNVFGIFTSRETKIL